MSESFDRGGVTPLRHAVAAAAGRAGLAGQRLDDFVLAVNELLTNAVRHGGGTGSVDLWAAGGEVVCEVTDRGGGLAGPRPPAGARPALHQTGGWGLWLAEELTDSFAVKTGEDGTTVRITSRTT